MKTLMLIDSNAIIHRAYHAIPKTFRTRKGEQTNAVYGFTTTLIKAIEDIKPDYIAASFDVSKATFRHKEYALYKATRVKADQELYDQIPRTKQLLETLGIPIYEKEGYEADDVIGTIVQKIQDRRKQVDELKDVAIYVVSGDKDIFQLIDGNIFVYNLKAGLSQTQVVDRTKIKEDWGLDPEDFIDLKALAGDPSDNIPGVPGIGPKTAISLLQKFDTLEGIYSSIQNVISSHPEPTVGWIEGGEKSRHNSADTKEDLSAIARDDKIVELIAKDLNIKPRILNLLIEYKDQAFLSQKLATIERNVPIEFDLEKTKWGNYDKDKLKNLFEELQFHSLLKRFGVEPALEPKTKEAKEQKKKDEQLKLL